MNLSPGLFQAWANYYLLTAAAAATLAGLLFVGLTLAKGVVVGEDAAEAIRLWAEPILRDFMQVLAVSALAEWPGLNPKVFGVLLALAALERVGRCVELAAYFRKIGDKGDLTRGDWMELIVLPLLAQAAALAACAGLFLGGAWAAQTLAAFTLGLLLLGLNNTWSLMAWMVVQKKEP